MVRIIIKGGLSGWHSITRLSVNVFFRSLEGLFASVIEAQLFIRLFSEH